MTTTRRVRSSPTLTTTRTIITTAPATEQLVLQQLEKNLKRKKTKERKKKKKKNRNRKIRKAKKKNPQ